MLKTAKMLTGVSYIFTCIVTFLVLVSAILGSIDVLYVSMLIGAGFIPCAIISGVVAFILSCRLTDKRAKYTLMIANAISLFIGVVVAVVLLVLTR